MTQPKAIADREVEQKSLRRPVFDRI